MSNKIIPSPFYQYPQDKLVEFIRDTMPKDLSPPFLDYSEVYDKGDLYYSIVHKPGMANSYVHMIWDGEVKTQEAVKKHAKSHIEVARHTSFIETGHGYSSIELLVVDAQESYNYGVFKAKKVADFDVPDNISRSQKKFLEEHLIAFLSNGFTFPERVSHTLNDEFKKAKKQHRLALS